MLSRLLQCIHITGTYVLLSPGGFTCASIAAETCSTRIRATGPQVLEPCLSQGSIEYCSMGSSKPAEVMGDVSSPRAGVLRVFSCAKSAPKLEFLVICSLWPSLSS